jgi:phosphate acetyltransferase
MPLGATLNVQLVKTLSAQVILTGSLAGLSMEEFDERLEVSGSQYGGLEGGAVIGCIINHVPNPQKLPLAGLRDFLAAKSRVLERGGFHLAERHPAQSRPHWPAAQSTSPGTLGAESAARRRRFRPAVQRKFPCLRAHRAQYAAHVSGGSVLVTPIDRSDVMMAVALSAFLKTPMAGASGLDVVSTSTSACGIFASLDLTPDCRVLSVETSG